MTDFTAGLGWVFLCVGTFFCVAGSLGLLRLPDCYSRMHAVTKADTLGLGLVVFGLILQQPQWHNAVLMLLTWLLAMISGATSSQLLARYQRLREQGREHDD